MRGVIRLAGEPIIISTHEESFTLERVRENQREIVKCMEEIEGRCYVITNLLSVKSTFVDVMAVLEDSRPSKAKTLSSPRVTVVLVGADGFTRMLRDVMSQPQMGSRQIPIFDNLDDALTAVRYMITTEGTPL